MAHAERQYYFGINGRNEFKTYKRPVIVNKEQYPGSTEDKPLTVKPGRIDTKQGPGQYTFAHNVGPMRSLFGGQEIIFSIPKSKIDGADLPTIVFPNGLHMINPRLSKEAWDEAYPKAMKEIMEDEREQMRAYNRMIERRYRRPQLPSSV